MSIPQKDLLKLMKMAAGADKSSPAVAFSYEGESFTLDQVNETVRTELAELAGTLALYRRNQPIIFELIENTIDEVIPKRVMDQYGQFAEVQNLKQGDKAVFTQRITEASRLRAAQFVTKVGQAGTYEVFKLDGQSLTVETTTYGGAAMISIEEFLDGRITFADVLDIVLLGLDEVIYTEIAQALISSINNLPLANVVAANGFVEASFDRLVNTADIYGPATIYCTYEFATKMLPAEAWRSDGMKDTYWSQGYFANYKSHRVIILPQSFTDATNTTKVINPGYAWIIPGGSYKPVKIAFEGQAIVSEFQNRDLSREVQIYKKFGVATMVTNSVCSYEDTALSADLLNN